MDKPEVAIRLPLTQDETDFLAEVLSDRHEHFETINKNDGDNRHWREIALFEKLINRIDDLEKGLVS